MGNEFVIGLDFGTGGPSAIAKNRKGEVIASYGCSTVKHANGIQKLTNWKASLGQCIRGALWELQRLGISPFESRSICISAQMHGLIIIDENGQFINVDDGVRLWNYPGSAVEASQLTGELGAYFAQRLGVTRFLEYVRNYPGLAPKIAGFTSPSGAMTMMLGGPTAWGLDYGDGGGEFPIDTRNRCYDALLAQKFDDLFLNITHKPLLELLPPLYNVGTIIGAVDQAGSELSGLPVGTPICIPTGDQPSAIVGAYACEIGTAAGSFGTSACLNHIIAPTKKQFANAGCDPFTTTDGNDTIMNHIEYGTTFLNSVLSTFARNDGFKVVEGIPEGAAFKKYMPLAEQANDDCDGILMIPIEGPEHGLGLSTVGTSVTIGLNGKNGSVGNLARAALTSPLYTLRYSVETMRRARILTKEYILTGGVLKGIKPMMGQLWANVFNTPTRVYNDSCTEGSTDGAATMALYGWRLNDGEDLEWEDFIKEMRPKDAVVYMPQPEKVAIHQIIFERFQRIVDVGALNAIVNITCE